MNLKQLIAIAALALISAGALAQTAPTFTFGVSGTSTDGKTIKPTITWSTTPAASSCTATATPAKADWTGTKPAQGAAIQLTAVSATTSFSLLCNWPGDQVALVSWVAPTTNGDGTALTDLAGFRIQWGQVSGDPNMDHTTYLQDPKLTSWTSPTLTPAGPWFFGVKAFNSAGLESLMSNITTKTITLTNAITRSMDIVIRFPGAPTSVTVN